MLSAHAAHRGQTPPTCAANIASFTVDGNVYTCTVNKVKYCVNYDINFYTVLGSVMDGGANGGVTGNDMLIISICDHSKVDISGVSDTTVLDLTLCQGASVITTESGRKIIGIFHQYANLLGKGEPYIPSINWKILVRRLMQDLNT
jgi:hypothetical protein